MKAYNLLSIKSVSHYVKNGYTKKQAEQIINATWDDDEVYTNKTEYIKDAKIFAKYCSKKLGFNVKWQVVYGEPKWEGLMYCTRCGEFYWGDDCCGC